MIKSTTFQVTCPDCKVAAGEIELEKWNADTGVICPGCGVVVTRQLMQDRRKSGVTDQDHFSAMEERKAQQPVTAVPAVPVGPADLPVLPEIVQPHGSFRHSIMSIEDAKALWDAFEETKKQLLTGSDVMLISKKPYIRKSGWRKIATRFRISTEPVRVSRMGRDHPIEYRASVKAVAMDGRFTFGVGFCSESEKDGWSKHPEHDIMAMAEVRATNRAIADMVGCAEVSAEEVSALKKVKGSERS